MRQPYPEPCSWKSAANNAISLGDISRALATCSNRAHFHTWGPAQPLNIWSNRIARFHQIWPNNLILGLSEHSFIVFCGVLGDTILVPNLRDGLKSIMTSFSSTQTLNMGRIGLIRWIMNMFVVGPRKVKSLHYTFSSRMLGLQIDPTLELKFDRPSTKVLRFCIFHHFEPGI